MIDCPHKADFIAITIEDLKTDPEKNGISVKPGNIVLIRQIGSSGRSCGHHGIRRGRNRL